MRPRKKLLLYCADPDRAGVMAYTLRQQPWCTVEVCGSMAELRAVLTDTVFAGALMLDAEDAIQQAVKDAQPDCRMLAVGIQSSAMNVPLASDASTAVIVEALRTLTAAKRGPKQGPWSNETRAKYEQAWAERMAKA